MAEGTDSQKLLQSLSDEYQKLQGDLQTSVNARQRLEAQQQENLGVQKEFKNLKEESTIYKLIGSVLLKQERAEAVAAVDGRLDYIGGEIKRIEQQLKSLQEKSESKKMEVYQLQNQLQQAQEQGQAQAAA